MVKYKFIVHERTEDAPFVGALICANGCNIKCKGCFNKDLKKLPAIEESVEDIIQQVKENIFNEGIILGGLEWSEQPLELVQLAQTASDANLKVMIYTGLTFNDFYTRIGQACYEQYLTECIINGEDILQTEETYNMVGRMLLDYYITEDYYIKCGSYDREQLVPDRVHFGVKLASENQNIYYIKKVEEV